MSPTTQSDQIARIDDLTRNARGTWFGLLGVLTFVGVTLLSIQPIDFYGVDRSTELPIVGIAILTKQFTIYAPIVTAIFFCYFHVQLIRLWDAIALADQPGDSDPLARHLSPWLIVDLALQLRNWRQGDNSTDPRALDLVSAVLNILLAWVFGLFVGFANWWWPMVARDLDMSLIAAAAFLAMLLCAYASAWVLWHRMGGDRSAAPTHLFRSVPAAITGLLTVPLVLILTHSRTHEPSDWIALAPLDLTGEDIVEHPADWLPYDIARAEFLDTWCKRALTTCVKDQDPPKAFEDEWQSRRTAALAALKKPSWSDIKGERPDLRGANLFRTFLAGANLSEAQMEGAILIGAQMKGANLSRALLTGTSDAPNLLHATNLRASINNGGALRFVDVTSAEIDDRTDWRNAFFDSSVTVPPHMRD